VKDWIVKLTKEEGKTVVLTTHQLDMAQELCDRVAIIRKGRLLTDQPLNELLHFFRQEHYQIRIKGDLDCYQIPVFAGLTIANENGDTTLSGAITDQAALHAHLSTIQNLNLPLLSVTRVEPNLEEVFMQLLHGGEKEEPYENRIVSYVQ
jgi:ABC-2 type transport system ATP-binding protein